MKRRVLDLDAGAQAVDEATLLDALLSPRPK